MSMGHCAKCQDGKMDKAKLGGAPLASAVIVVLAVLFLGGLHFGFAGSVNF